MRAQRKANKVEWKEKSALDQKSGERILKSRGIVWLPRKEMAVTSPI